LTVTALSSKNFLFIEWVSSSYRASSSSFESLDQIELLVCVNRYSKFVSKVDVNGKGYMIVKWSMNDNFFIPYNLITVNVVVKNIQNWENYE